MVQVKAVYIHTDDYGTPRFFTEYLRELLDLEKIEAEAKRIAAESLPGVRFGKTYDRVAEWQYQAMRELLAERGLALDVASGYNAWDQEYDEFNAFVPQPAAQGEDGKVQDAKDL